MTRTSVLIAAFVAMTAPAIASPAYIDQIDASFSVNPAAMAPSMEMLEPAMTSLATVTTQLNSIDVPVGGLSLISQSGDNNMASIVQTGPYNLGIIRQIGYQNNAMLFQSGGNHRALIYQNGSNNTAIVRQR